MKHWLLSFVEASIILLVSALLSGCGTVKQMQIVTQVQRDTLYLNKLQYDSVYVYQNLQTDRSKDTVYIRDVQYQYKYKLLRDTVRIVQIDSIPVIKTVEIVKTERYTPAIYKWSLGLCVALIILIILYAIWKIKF